MRRLWVLTKGKRLSLVSVGAGCAAVAVLQFVLPRVPSADAFYVDRVVTDPRSVDFLPGTASGDVRVICFLDLECPWCAKKLPTYVDVVESRRRAWPGVNIAIELRHYPLDMECNPLASARKATLGCEGAAVLEAVAELYGRHEVLRTAQSLMAGQRKSLSQMARDAKIDGNWLEANYARLLRNVEADVDLGLSNGVLVTPTVVVNGVKLRSPSPEVLAAVVDREVLQSRTSPRR